MKKRQYKDNKIKRSQYESNLQKKKDSEREIRTDLKGVLVRIYPVGEQITFIKKAGGCRRLIYNVCNAFKLENKADKEEEYRFELEMDFEFRGKKATKKQKNKIVHDGVGISDFGEILTKMKKSGNYDFLYEINRNILSQSYMDLSQAWSNFYKNPWHFDVPTFKKKNNHCDSFRVPIRAIPGGQSSEGLKCIHGNRIDICTELKDIHFKCSRRDEKFLNKNQSKIKSITVSEHPDGNFYASVLICDDETWEEISANENIFSFDLGIKEYLIGKQSKLEKDENGFIKTKDDSESKYVHIENPKIRRNNEKKKIHAQRDLARSEKGSNRYEKKRKRLAKIQRKDRNRMIDFQHKLSTDIVNENQVICSEDLNVIGMQSNHNLAKAIQDVAWRRFMTMIEYKARKRGRIVERSDTFFPSSKTCNGCGYHYGGLKLSERSWICPHCGKLVMRDENAADNLESNGVKIHNEKVREKLLSEQNNFEETQPKG